MARKGTEKNALIRSVAEIYMKEGLRVTMDELSKRLKISKRTIYEQFEDKTDLVRACVRHIQGQMPPHMEINQDTVVAYLFDLMDNHVRELFGARARFILHLQEEYPELYEEMYAPLQQKAKSMLIMALAKGEDCGFVRPGFNGDLLLSYLFKEVYMVTSDVDNKAESYSVDEILRHSLHPTLKGLLTEKGVRALEALERKSDRW